MNLTSRGKTYLLIALLSFLFSYLIITFNFFPSLGMSLSLILFTLFGFKFKKDKTQESKKYFFFTLTFSTLIFVRSEPFVTFLNLSASLFFGSLMLTTGTKSQFGILDSVFSPITLLSKSLLVKSDYFFEQVKKGSNQKTRNSLETVFGIFLSVFLLLIVVPLLSSVNPIFQKLVENILNFFNLENLLKNIGFETVFRLLTKLIFFLLFLFIIPKIISLVERRVALSLPSIIKPENLTLSIPKAVMLTVLTVFLVTQIQFYFASPETLQNLGVTYSQRAREVFGQLLVVAGILILLIYNDRAKTKLNKYLNTILGIQGFFLVCMAYKSDIEYINAWGLTYIRLYGLTIATWVLGVFIILFRNISKSEPYFTFVKNSIFFSALMLLLVNISNFDFLIYNFKKAATGQGVDYTYLSTLSPDSLSYKDQFMTLEKETGEDGYSLSEYNNKNPFIILYKVERLQEKYRKIDFRALNLMEYIQYLQIKSVDTKKMREFYSYFGRLN